MKKSRKIVSLALVLGICVSMMSFAIGEEEAPVAAAETQQAVQPPESSAVAEIQNAEPAPGLEQTEVESTAPADGAIEIEDARTPLALSSPQPPFTGVPVVERKGEGALCYGDRVTLTAKIYDANRAYQIRWEVDCHDGLGWRPIYGENDLEYDFVVDHENVGYEYRVVLVTEP